MGVKKSFNEDLIDCIDYIMEKTGETSHIHVDIFKKKWGKRRGNELYTFLSYNEALQRNDVSKNKIRVLIPEGVRLREEARLKIISEKQNRIVQKQTWFIAISVIIAFLVGGFNIMYQADQNELVNKQMGSIIPVMPTLKFRVKPNLQYGAYEFADYYWINETFYRSHPELQIILYNIGKMDTGHIVLYLDLKDRNFSSNTLNIRNIKGLSANKSHIQLRYDECYYDPNEKEEFKERCNRDTIPLGKRTLQFVGTCDYCDKQNFTVSIDVCIWRNSSRECEAS